MTLLNMIELVQVHFPDVGHTLIKNLLNTHQRRFASETRVLKGTVEIDVEAEEAEYEIPATIDAVWEIELVDDDYATLDNQHYYRIQERTIYFTNHVGERLSSMPTGAYRIIVHGTVFPSELLSDSQEPDIDGQFHLALVHAVLAELYATAKGKTVDEDAIVLRRAVFFRDSVAEQRRIAKKWASRLWDSTPSNVTYVHF